MTNQVLIVDDDPQMQFFLKEALERQQYGVSVVPSAEAAIDAIRTEKFDLILMDVRLPGMSGLEAVDEIQKLERRTPIIVMTAHGTRDSALDAVRRGAYDYFTKPFSLDEMEIVVRRALRTAAAAGRARAAQRTARGGPSPGPADRIQPCDGGGLHADRSRGAHRLDGPRFLARAAPERSSSPRRFTSSPPAHGKPFVKLNCAAIPETLLESELFGHEKGAFTGALGRKPGKFEQADGGTLLLDEIGDMTLSTQAKILRALQERELQRVGGTQTITVNVRILASTNKDLEKAVREGTFRDDLYFRLNVVTINVPPLRDRRDEIPELADHFLAEANSRLNRSILRLAPDTLAALMEYGWPGNVRELRNVIERAAVVSDGDVLLLGSLPAALRPAEPPSDRRTMGGARQSDPR